MAPPLQFAYRTQKAISVFDAAPVYEPVPGLTNLQGNQRCCAYSPCGRFFGWASSEAVTVSETTTGKEVLSLPMTNVYELGFSPRGTFLITWERPSKDEGHATKNLKVWRVVEADVAAAEKQPVGQFVQKQQGGWNLQYTADEKYCAHLVTNEVQFFESHNLVAPWNKLILKDVSNFALAPGNKHAVAVFVRGKSGGPAAIKVYNVPSFQNPISQKTFYQGDKVQFKWNKQGSSILVLAQSDVDKSGKSYYGETTLYLLSTNGTIDARVTLDKEGPIHDVSWSATSRQFGVVYGFMPAKTTIFNDRGVAVHSFPIGPRNTINFSPNGRFVLVAGFGNLAGQIDVYDMEKDHRKVCTIQGGNPSVCEWSPDSNYIMTATTSPRLRVDNGVKLWHVSGGLMYNEDMVELYNVSWRPVSLEDTEGGDPLSSIPAPHPSAAAYLGTVKTPSKPAGAYRPPGARGLATPLHFKREDEGGAAHVVSNGTQSVGTNGFGRSRRAVPGAELADGNHAVRTVPGAELAGEDGPKKNKKKRSKRNNNNNNNNNQGENKLEPEPSGGASLAPPTENGFGSGSPERPGVHAGRNNHSNRGYRSRSRPNDADRSRNNGHQGPRGQGNGHHAGQQGNGHHSNGHHGNGQQGNGQQGNGQYAGQQGAPPVYAPTEPAASQQPNAKKIRSLQKKVRAIEDLEMRLAGGEKLEDTQLQKIHTKSSVLKELESLGGEF